MKLKGCGADGREKGRERKRGMGLIGKDGADSEVGREGREEDGGENDTEEKPWAEVIDFYTCKADYMYKMRLNVNGLLNVNECFCHVPY